MYHSSPVYSSRQFKSPITAETVCGGKHPTAMKINTRALRGESCDNSTFNLPTIVTGFGLQEHAIIRTYGTILRPGSTFFLRDVWESTCCL